MASKYLGAPGQSSGLTMPPWQQTGTTRGAPGSTLKLRPDEVAWALPGSSKGYNDDQVKELKGIKLRNEVNKWSTQSLNMTNDQLYEAFQNENPEVSPDVVKTFIDDQILRRIGR